jgi:putative hydrolase of the HAD superfamily
VPRFRAVIFDFFGTLSHAVERGGRHDVVADLLGCDRQALIDVLDRSFLVRASGQLGDARASLRWLCRRLGTRPTEAALDAALAARLDAVRADTRLRADAVATLRALRHASLRTGLISDCTHELPVILPDLPVFPLLDIRVLSVAEGRCKPDPALYLAACGRLGVAPPDCLYVGDGGSRELTGAVRAGLSAVRLAAPDLAGHLVFDPDLAWSGPLVRSLGEVVALATGGDPDRPVSAGGPGATGTGCGAGEPLRSAGAAPRASRRAAWRRRPAARPPAPTD